MSSKPRTQQPYQRPRRSDFFSAAEDTTSDAIGSARVNRLAVSGLHYEISEADLVKIFQPYGAFTRNPTIRYDRSGRSTGFAYVNYENQEDANLAKRELDGVLAKGEPISISVDSFVPRNAPKEPIGWSSTSRSGASGGGSLKDRISKTPLIHRLTDDNKADNKADAMVIDSERAPGPVRNQRGARRGVSDRAPRPERNGGGGGGRGARDAKPKTADDLDKELEAYVHKGGAEPAAAAPTTGDDVVMAA